MSRAPSQVGDGLRDLVRALASAGMACTTGASAGLTTAMSAAEAPGCFGTSPVSYDIAAVRPVLIARSDT
ncbi:hypothetical protein [Amycolatopsis ultiminotia]|uniref:hypothetical protein n=1 Tax=Amycolatopsis ultiminotia TaxID=543629 RepID=UPI0031F0727A